MEIFGLQWYWVLAAIGIAILVAYFLSYYNSHVQPIFGFADTSGNYLIYAAIVIMGTIGFILVFRSLIKATKIT